MKAIFIALFIFWPVFLSAQTQLFTTTNKEAIKNYNKAQQSINYQLNDQAISQLTTAVGLDANFLEAQNQLADLLRAAKKFKPAIEHYLKIVAANPEFNRAIYINLAHCEINTGDYENTQVHVTKYLSYPNLAPDSKRYADLLLSDCVFSLEAIKHPVPFNPQNLGPAINGVNDEYQPDLTADESTLIFTRKINDNEDFYKSTKKAGQWTDAVYLSKNINTTDFNEGAQSITQDGKFLFFAGCDRPDGLGKCDIYVTQKIGDDWGTPHNLGAPVNTRAWESQPTISSDGLTLYFVSNRKGGYGGYDIWKSTITDKGWSEPENMGPNINTPYDEQSPFIHPDDNTLYFSSNGWPGFGNMDVFVSKRDKDGNWQKPHNMGYPINTYADDSGLTLNANGNLAYFSSNNLKGYGGFDIYSFEIPVGARPQVVTYVKGSVYDGKSKQPLIARVEIVDLETNKTVYLKNSDKDGYFLSTLTYGKNYGLNISRKGYLFYSENFSLEGADRQKQFEIDVPLQAIEAGSKVVLKNIFFDTNKFEIKKESKTELEKLILFLNQNPKVVVEISGHTDDVGDDQKNQILSQNRAKEVYTFLVSQHIDAKRLTYKGYGKSKPITTNTNEEGRKLNRRTEFTIISN